MNSDGKIIRTSLLFATSTLLTPVLVVAKRSAVGDWAAYCAGISMLDAADHEAESAIAQEVAAVGFKLTAEQATAFFPNVKGDYRS